MIQPLFWENERLLIVDQTRLPFEYKLIEINDDYEMADAIRRMVIRGAPAIGIAAAYGLALGLKKFTLGNHKEFFHQLEIISARLYATRPTAVNLGWALNRLKRLAELNRHRELTEIHTILLNEAHKIHAEDILMCRQIAARGLSLLPDDVRVITHCNAGGLATGGLGTALGIIINAHQSGKKIHVYVDETRPMFQGARLTAWELTREKVPFTLISDNMAAFVMASNRIDAVIVGADRIAANGDTANKIGTALLAIAAKHYQVPFYIAAPSSSIDSLTPTGAEIKIEERDGAEVKEINGQAIVPISYSAISPAFDITPARLITAIITEKDIYRPPFVFK
ncbi:MAG TPA: S-methyl-5-thioribose-1-phosphate isomerase [Candidatus Marinimicrobia bacterium]|nr:S-methyl-5-thioribose-1-phosphate isomerase [Candidatus Neomarinimicrobiota bacterium]HRS51932.1 S-methyl-5-thioribose-1-phosphate isomerase [Candidatus Neomarinimicrobiota bacterium]HRU92941.1 S-methyl-5-thioribose-1-phosphate isomerase [Candidatus Neomarinimicrobiota bacterium]